MYLNRKIEIDLTVENQLKLEKPSKAFNKIKAIFSGDMTPTEANRAEVMLSVLQRMNKSLRAAQITKLVTLTVNKQIIYQHKDGENKDLKEGILRFVQNKKEQKISVFKHLRQTVKHIRNDILFVYDIEIIKKPKKGEAPVTVLVSGFPCEFTLSKNEQPDNLEERITNFLKSNCSTSEQVRAFNKKYLDLFDKEVDRVIVEFKKLFPAGCSSTNYKVRLLSRDDKQKLNQRHDSYFASNVLFMDYWLSSESVTKFSDGGECVDLFETGACENFDGSLSANSETSWLDSMSSSINESNFGDSSCGGGCGGGCGD